VTICSEKREGRNPGWGAVSVLIFFMLFMSFMVRSSWVLAVPRAPGVGSCCPFGRPDPEASNGWRTDVALGTMSTRNLLP